KRANVMLDGQGKVRITDFGLAGLEDSFRGDDVRSGTPAYMSPEQLTGREVTARSDVYSLGLVLYELFTGKKAFEGKTFAELLRKHRDETPVEPSLLVPDLAPAVDRPGRLLYRAPATKPPAVLEDHARDFIRRMGHPAPEADADTGFGTDMDYLRHVSEKDASTGRWEGLATGQPAVVSFHYRQS